MSGKKLLIAGLILALLIAIPSVLYVISLQQPKKPQTVASTKLEFSPATGIKKVNDMTEFKIKVDPGANAVSFISLDITYDASKFEAVNNALTIDKTVVPIVMQGPVYTPGRIRANLSTGNDPSAALTKPVALGSLKLKAIAPTNGDTTSIAFGSGTQILSVSTSSDASDSSGQNVLSSSTPAQFMIAEAQPSQLVAAASPMPSGESTIQPTNSTATEEESSPTPEEATVANEPDTTTAPTTSQAQSVTAQATSTPTPTIKPATPTPTKAPATPTPTKTVLASALHSPTPTTVKAVAGISDVPTETPTDTATVSDTSTSLDSPTPTLEPTGPGLTYLGLGALFLVLIIGGGLLLMAL